MMKSNSIEHAQDLFTRDQRTPSRRKLSDLSLSELLEMRDRVREDREKFIATEGKSSYSMLMGKLQHWIWYRRTHRKSGLIIPYSKDITSD